MMCGVKFMVEFHAGFFGRIRPIDSTPLTESSRRDAIIGTSGDGDGR